MPRLEGIFLGSFLLKEIKYHRVKRTNPCAFVEAVYITEERVRIYSQVFEN
jgi:hypothetical protein